MSDYVLDASALMAMFNQEKGSEQVASCINAGAIVSSVNLCEVVTKLSEGEVPEEVIHQMLDVPGLTVVDFDADDAYEAGLLRPLTKRAGLSLGDRACLVLAKRLQLPAVTADRVWEKLSVGVIVQLIRGYDPGKKGQSF